MGVRLGGVGRRVGRAFPFKDLLLESLQLGFMPLPFGAALPCPQSTTNRSPAPSQVALALALGESMAHRLRCRLFSALLQRDPLFFDSVRTGQLSAWLGQDIEVLQVRSRLAGWPAGWW